MEVDRISIASILVGERRRQLDASRVQTLADSVKELGLRTPITVRIIPEATDADGVVVEDVPVLVAGLHRLEAAKLLGWEFIEAFTLQGDETDARLWEISENLHRSELTKLERDEHIAEWVRLTDGKLRKVSAESGGRGNTGGIREAARQLGADEKAVRNAIRVASTTDEAKLVACEAGLDDNQSALLTIAKAEPERQVEVARDLAAAKAERRGRRETNSAFDKMTKEDATEQLASLLAEQLPGEHWTTCTALLYAAGCANVAKALNRLTGAPVFDNTKAGRAA